MTEEVVWKDFSLTHLEYPSGDWLGLVLCVFSLLPLAMIVSILTLILFRRDLHTICFFVGVCVCELLNTVLKLSLKQGRPVGRRTHFSKYGMPSSHSQLSWFLAVYLTLFLLVRLHSGSGQSCLLRWWRQLAAVLCCFCSLIVSYSRVYLEYHTTWQVICGAGVGVSLAAIWFLLVHNILTPLFPAVVQWRLCEMLLICDTSSIPSIFWFEYTHKRMESRARWRRSHSSNKLQ